MVAEFREDYRRARGERERERDQVGGYCNKVGGLESEYKLCGR